MGYTRKTPVMYGGGDPVYFGRYDCFVALIRMRKVGDTSKKVTAVTGRFFVLVCAVSW